MSTLSCNQEKFISPDNVNFIFQKTFEFIQENQISESGTIFFTQLFLKLSLTNYQSPIDQHPRQSAANTITGYVNSVSKTSVVIISKSINEGKYDEYVIEYSKIIEIASEIIKLNMKDYINVLETLPPIYLECKNQYKEILTSLNKTINKYYNEKNKAIRIIFNGVNTRNINIKNIVIKRNFIIIEDFFIFPITVISGYIVVPTFDNIKYDEIVGGSYV